MVASFKINFEISNVLLIIDKFSYFRYLLIGIIKF